MSNAAGRSNERKSEKHSLAYLTEAYGDLIREVSEFKVQSEMEIRKGKD